MSPKWAGLFVALAAALVATAPNAASERSPRPYDALLLEAKGAQVPALPAPYLLQEEGGIRFWYHPLARERIRPLFSKVGAMRAELSAQLGMPVLDTLEVRVASAHSEMAHLSPAELPPYVTAVAFSELRLVLMSLGSPLSLEPPDLEEWLRHELAHIALDEALAPTRDAAPGPRVAAVPRWFHEGFSVHMSGENSAARAQTLCLATFRERVLPLRDLEGQFPADAPQASVAYAQAAELVRFLAEKPKREKFSALLRGVREGATFDAALAEAYGGDPGELEQTFRKELAKRFGFLPVLIGATSIWVLVAAIVLARRWQRRRAGVSTRRFRRDRSEHASRSVRPARLRTPREPEETMEPIPPDPEVPKIEHDGRWYTLH